MQYAYSELEIKGHIERARNFPPVIAQAEYLCAISKALFNIAFKDD
jgi:hypothetical protein